MKIKIIVYFIYILLCGVVGGLLGFFGYHVDMWQYYVIGIPYCIVLFCFSNVIIEWIEWKRKQKEI